MKTRPHHPRTSAFRRAVVAVVVTVPAVLALSATPATASTGSSGSSGDGSSVTVPVPVIGPVVVPLPHPDNWGWE